VPPVTVALLHSPITAFWVIIAYVGIQEVEGHIAAPLIMGTRFRVHPLVVIFAVLIGNQLHGIVGMFIAVPLIPLGRETWIFFRARVRFEGWTTGGVGLARPTPDTVRAAHAVRAARAALAARPTALFLRHRPQELPNRLPNRQISCRNLRAPEN
jgi:hypothetical protein